MTNIYVGYCGGKSKSETVIIDHRPFFDQLKVKLGSNESLSSYLIRPIQRITKYPLMMKVSLMLVAVLRALRNTYLPSDSLLDSDNTAA